MAFMQPQIEFGAWFEVDGPCGTEWIPADLVGELVVPKRYIATFDPQVWVNDYAISVDPEGDTTWDCTEFVTNPPDWCDKDCFEGLDQEIANTGAFLDEDDVLLDDSAAPEWIREWSGPFSITVDSRLSIPPALADYCENREAWSIKRIEGWGARMSAPGYMDCTEWCVFETEQEAQEYLREHYLEQEEGEHDA